MAQAVNVHAVSMESALDYYESTVGKSEAELAEQKFWLAVATANRAPDELDRADKKTNTWVYDERLFVESDDEADVPEESQSEKIIQLDPQSYTSESSTESGILSTKLKPSSRPRQEVIVATKRATSLSDVPEESGPEKIIQLDPQSYTSESSTEPEVLSTKPRTSSIPRQEVIGAKKRAISLSDSDSEQQPLSKKSRAMSESPSPKSPVLEPVRRYVSDPTHFTKKDAPDGYTEDQWEHSYKRATSKVRTLFKNQWRTYVSDEISEQEAKETANRKACEAVARIGCQEFRERALEDDKAKAEAKGISLSEWLALWSEGVQKARSLRGDRKVAAKAEKAEDADQDTSS